jgi:hypothetical protein
MRSIRDGAVDTVQVYGIRPFAFDPAAPVYAAGMLALLQVAFIVVYGGALGIALRELGSCREPRRAAGFGLLCVGLADWASCRRRCTGPTCSICYRSPRRSYWCWRVSRHGSPNGGSK